MKQTWTKNLIQKDVTTITARNYKDGVFTTLFSDEDKI